MEPASTGVLKMRVLQAVVANLERQREVYSELDSLLAQQRAALTARNITALDAVNSMQARLTDALGTLEAERQSLVDSLPGRPLCLHELLDLATDAGLRDRLTLLCDHLPGLVERVVKRTRTNRVLAADAGASTAHLLGLLGLAQDSSYAPPTRPMHRSGQSLRLDVQA